MFHAVPTADKEEAPPEQHYQPEWEHSDDIDHVTTAQHGAPAIVPPAEIDLLNEVLAAADPHTIVLQVGDCVEDLGDATAERTAVKTSELQALGDILRAAGRSVLLVGRLGGQYAKPRSAALETRDGKTFMTFRGPIVHAPEADERRRAGNAHRVATCRLASDIVTRAVRAQSAPDFVSGRIWTSHEALLLDYELPQVKKHEGRRYLTSTAWPWIGNRTRTIDGSHVSLAASVVNPVSVKISTGTSVAEVLRLAARINPRNEPGRLTLIARYGAARIDELAPLALAVKEQGVAVRWVSDPMHGNTFANAQGIKTRLVGDVLGEAREFARILRSLDVAVGGIHLEATPDNVQECVEDVGEVIDPARYTTGCDPRLSSAQAARVLEGWLAA